jgi:UDP-2-acetamido-3-amino-2,3-dideoxy-glucuronate N-acetyltransferase
MIVNAGEGRVGAAVTLGPGAQVHESAYVDDGAQIGAGTRVWHFCHVLGGAVVGARCSLGQNVVVMNGVRLGDNVKVQNNVSIYEGVELEDDVFCGPSMVFTNVYNPRSAVSRKDEYRRTLVRRGASIGANATIVCGVTIGRYAFIGAGAVVNRDVADYALMAGVPAQRIGWMSESGFRLEHVSGSTDDPGPERLRCSGTGALYRRVGETVSPLPSDGVSP